LKKGQEVWVRWRDDSVHQLRLVREKTHGWEVVYLTGDWKGRPALIEKVTLREIAERMHG